MAQGLDGVARSCCAAVCLTRRRPPPRLPSPPQLLRSCVEAVNGLGGAVTGEVERCVYACGVEAVKARLQVLKPRLQVWCVMKDTQRRLALAVEAVKGAVLQQNLLPARLALRPVGRQVKNAGIERASSPGDGSSCLEHPCGLAARRPGLSTEAAVWIH